MMMRRMRRKRKRESKRKRQKNFSSENFTTRVRSKGFKCRLPQIESTPTRCSTPRRKFNRAKRFSVVNRGARTGLKHRAWRSSCGARHNVERDISSELCRRSTLRVCRGLSVTATSISARTSLGRAASPDVVRLAHLDADA